MRRIPAALALVALLAGCAQPQTEFLASKKGAVELRAMQTRLVPGDANTVQRGVAATLHDLGYRITKADAADRHHLRHPLHRAAPGRRGAAARPDRIRWCAPMPPSSRCGARRRSTRPISRPGSSSTRSAPPCIAAWPAAGRRHGARAGAPGRRAEHGERARGRRPARAPRLPPATPIPGNTHAMKPFAFLPLAGLGLMLAGCMPASEHAKEVAAGDATQTG